MEFWRAEKKQPQMPKPPWSPTEGQTWERRVGRTARPSKETRFLVDLVEDGLEVCLTDEPSAFLLGRRPGRGRGSSHRAGNEAHCQSLAGLRAHDPAAAAVRVATSWGSTKPCPGGGVSEGLTLWTSLSSVTYMAEWIARRGLQEPSGLTSRITCGLLQPLGPWAHSGRSARTQASRAAFLGGRQAPSHRHSTPGRSVKFPTFQSPRTG